MTERVVAEARRAVAARDLEALRPLLHPYGHCVEPDGTVVRGRSNVLELLACAGPPPAPVSSELRDGQIYWWRADLCARTATAVSGRLSPPGPRAPGCASG